MALEVCLSITIFYSFSISRRTCHVKGSTYAEFFKRNVDITSKICIVFRFVTCSLTQNISHKKCSYGCGLGLYKVPTTWSNISLASNRRQENPVERKSCWFTVYKSISVIKDAYFVRSRGSSVVKVLCYKSEGRCFDLSWYHWNFSLT